MFIASLFLESAATSSLGGPRRFVRYQRSRCESVAMRFALIRFRGTEDRVDGECRIVRPMSRSVVQVNAAPQATEMSAAGDTISQHIAQRPSKIFMLSLRCFSEKGFNTFIFYYSQNEKVSALLFRSADKKRAQTMVLCSAGAGVEWLPCACSWSFLRTCTRTHTRLVYIA